MRTLFIGIFIVFFATVGQIYSQNQISILLVDDDNYSSPNHITRIENAITDAGYSYTLFNAQDSAASPTAATMQNYQLVMWYTANDGVGHYFWNGTDSDNPELISYLNSGGMLWVIGNDVLYDRYGGAPDTFQVGDFVYDYLGVSSYDVQSKVNDGGTGVPMLIKVPGQTIATLDTIRWYFSSGGLWYGDGCTPVSGAVPVYEFGPASYVLAGYKTSIYLDNGSSKVFSCFWDPYYMDSDINRAALFSDVLDWFNSQITVQPPTAFNLISPPSGTEIQINDSTQTVHFHWSESTDPQGGTITYSLILSESPALSPVLASYMSDSTGMILDNSTVLGLFSASDTLNLWWGVEASSSSGGHTSAADTFQLKLVENINEPPLPFHLLIPPDQFVFIIPEDSVQAYPFAWESSPDPDMNLESYRFRLWKTGGSVLLDTVVTDTSLSFATPYLLPLFTGSDTLRTYWTILASDSQFTTPALDTFALTLIKIPHVNQPPLPFSLLSPPDGAQILIDSLNQEINFRWESTSDPEGDSLYYTFQVFLTVPSGDSLILFGNLTDTSITVHGSDFLTLFGAFGDTLHCRWTINATDIFFNSTPSDTFALTVIENIPQLPTPSELLYPQAQKTLFFIPDSATNYTFFWKSSTDPDNDPLSYFLIIAKPDGTPIYSTVIQDTFHTVNLMNYLSGLGQDSVRLKWNVVTYDGTYQVPAANGPRDLLLLKQKISIVFVDDDNYSNHESYLYTALDNIGIRYKIFDCGALAGGDTVEQVPDAQYLDQFDLAIWFTGNDGVGLAFWNGEDSVNTELQDYLDNGGRLWISGNDFLYDRYSGAPDVFAPGDFVYDYLGIASYDAQSKVDDGGLGVPMLIRDDSCTVTTLDTLDWRYSTLWYVDAVTPVSDAQVMYRMGPASYVLANSPAALYLNTPTYLTVSCYFNIRQLNTENYNEKLEHLFADVLGWIQITEPIVGIGEPYGNLAVPKSFRVEQNYPNPFNPTTTINYRIPRAGDVTVTVYNLLGQKILTLSEKHRNPGSYRIKINASRWASGFYYYEIKYRNRRAVKKMLLLK